MDYNETLKYINNTPKFSKILGNDDLKKLLLYLGNPQDELKFIHVAGTNGKGSVGAMTAKILETAGFKTGLFTSPFIEVFNERIKINGKNIADDTLAEIATEVKIAIEKLKIEISVFAQITAIAFVFFCREKCDFVVLETGMGGRLDATNVIKNPLVCVITKIGLDHTEYLGNTFSEIAAEKCGIIKRGAPTVTCGNQNPEALCVIKDFAKKAASRLVIADNDSGFELSLKGIYQQSNASVAAEVARILGIGEDVIKSALLHTEWIARFEFLTDNLVIDGGHNPDGISALISSLRALCRPVKFVVAMMQDKDLRRSTALLAEFSSDVTVTQIDMPRCLKASELARFFPNCRVEADCIKAVHTALSDCKDGEIVCVCGSLYLAGEIRKHFAAGDK